MKKLIALFLALLLLPLVSAADYPSYNNYANDYAGVISPEYEAQINALAGQIERETTAQIAVLTVNDFGDTDINNYAVGLFREWGIGKKDTNNGLLILVKPKVKGQDGEWRIEVGYGMEGLITDGIAGRIGRNVMVPRFIEGDYGRGIFDAVVEIKGYISGEDEVVSKYSGDEGSVKNGSDFFYVAFFIALIIGGIVSLTTKKIENKKIKWGVKLGIGILVFLSLIIFWSSILAIIFLVMYLIMTSGGRGLMFFPGFGGGRGGGGGGGFGGFGGGFSGGGGAGGRW